MTTGGAVNRSWILFAVLFMKTRLWQEALLYAGKRIFLTAAIYSRMCRQWEEVFISTVI